MMEVLLQHLFFAPRDCQMKFLSMLSSSAKRHSRRTESRFQRRRILIESLERRYCFDGSAPTVFGEGTVTGPNIPGFTAGVSIDLAANDFDVDGDINYAAIELVIVSGPANGTLDLSDSANFGKVTYLPNVGFGENSVDQIIYKLRDLAGNLSEEATATITVDPHPIASDAIFRASYTTALYIPVSTIASDPYWYVDPTLAILQSPQRGTLTSFGDGDYYYAYDGEPVQEGEVVTDSFTFQAVDENGSLSNVGTVTIFVLPAPAIIDNGLIQLGVNQEGNLNVFEGSTVSSAGTFPTGLRYMPTNYDSTAPGCLCEGWGVADAATAFSGDANAEYGGARGMRFVSFNSTPYSAISVVDVDGVTAYGVQERGGGEESGGDGGVEPSAIFSPSSIGAGSQLIRVTHDYHPTALTPNLFEVTVTIENLSNTEAISDLRYRRVMDWDIEPTAFNEFVTIQGFDEVLNPNLLFTSNDGFASADPLSGPSSLGATGNFVDLGPTDHGALFDFGNFGVLEPGGKTSFNIYYGAAENESEAMDAISAVNARVYSIGKASSDPEFGTPNTFIFAFGNLRTNVENNIPPVANDDQLHTKFDTPSNFHASVLLENDTDPDGDAVSLRIESVDSLSINGGEITVNPQTFQISYVPPAGFRGVDSFTYRISDGLESDEAVVYVNVGAPTVAKVFALYGGAAGAAPTRSFEISPTTRVLPWAIKGVEIEFDSDISGADLLDISGASFSSASNSSGNTLRWIFSSSIFVGALNLSLRSGADGVFGADGLNLDGNSDGVAGDSFAFSFRALEGDFDGNGIVENLDVTRVLANRGSTNMFADIDGDGDVDNNDVTRARSRLRNRLPS
jgi:Bacterial Ig domain